MSGAVRLVTSSGSSPLTNNADSTYASATDPTLAISTIQNATAAFRNSAMAMQAAVASTGCISGASNMAPITTAAESADMPITATTTDRAIMSPNRNQPWSCRLIASSVITRWRSSESRCRCHQRLRLRTCTPRLGSSSTEDSACCVTTAILRNLPIASMRPRALGDQVPQPRRETDPWPTTT